jgi:DNA-binding LacI/PurR family transcriptional regulator
VLIVANDALLSDAILAIAEGGPSSSERLEVVAHLTAGENSFAPFPMTVIELDPAELSREIASEMAVLMKDFRPVRKQIKLPPRIFRTVDRRAIILKGLPV